MKIIALAVAIPLLTFGAASTAGKHQQTRFFRQYKGTPLKPNASGDPVVVNAASFLPGVSPGGLATVFGENLTDVSGVIAANAVPLPTRLAGVEVDVNGIPAPLYSVAYADGEDQINFQVPFETDTGPGAAEIDIFSFGVKTASVLADSFTEDPGIFIYNGYAVAAHADGSLVTPGDPANPGETIVLYTTGLGPVTVDVPDGFPGPLHPLAYTQDPFQALVAGEQCGVFFSGLAPGFVGLYQLNITLPLDLPSGSLNVQIATPYATSGIAKLPVF